MSTHDDELLRQMRIGFDNADRIREAIRAETRRSRSVDPRARVLAKARQHMAAREGAAPDWGNLPDGTKEIRISEAAEWLQAAVEAGIAPLAERPTDKHDAVWLDSYGQLWGEYQTSPSSDGDAILRLVWASEQCSSKREIEAEGVEFRLIGWSE